MMDHDRKRPAVPDSIAAAATRATPQWDIDRAMRRYLCAIPMLPTPERNKNRIKAVRVG
jgi:hypothetical protein